MKKLMLNFSWIILRSIMITAYYSLKVICYARKKTTNTQQFNTFITAWARALLQVIKVQYEIVNKHNLPVIDNTPYIFMSNHLSLYDIPLLLVSLPGTVRMVAKKELFKVPLWGRAMQRADFVAIDRNNGTQALQDLAVAAKKMQAGISLWIAPEGTRSPDGNLQAFKKGAFNLAIQTGAIIIPITIIGTNNILPAKTFNFHIGQKVTIHCGTPIDAKQYTLRQRLQLMQTVRDAIAAPLLWKTVQK